MNYFKIKCRQRQMQTWIFLYCYSRY